MYSRKHREKRRNCLLLAISPFSRNVFHSFISLVSQKAALCGNGLNCHSNTGCFLTGAFSSYHVLYKTGYWGKVLADLTDKHLR